MEKRQDRWKRQMKWIKEGAKNFRLSLSLRVSLNYLRFFLMNGLLFFGIMGFLYLWLEVKPSKDSVEQMVVLLEMDEEKFVEFVVKEQPEKLSVLWKNEAEVVTLYNSSEEDWQQYHYWLGKFHISRQEDGWNLFLQDRQEIFRNGEKFQIFFYFDLSDALVKAVVFFRMQPFSLSQSLGTVWGAFRTRILQATQPVFFLKITIFS